MTNECAPAATSRVTSSAGAPVACHVCGRCTEGEMACEMAFEPAFAAADATSDSSVTVLQSPLRPL